MRHGPDNVIWGAIGMPVAAAQTRGSRQGAEVSFCPGLQGMGVLGGPMKGHGQKMSRKANVLIANLLSESTYAAAARKTGISEMTLYRWLARDDFQEAYREAKRRVVDVAISRLCQLTAEAVAALERNLTATRSGDQIRSALGILENVRALMGEDVEDRLARLEEHWGKEGK